MKKKQIIFLSIDIYTAATHATGLSRPGPWNTIPALLSNFWKFRSLEGDFFRTALDRDTWEIHGATLRWLVRRGKTYQRWIHWLAVRGTLQHLCFGLPSHGCALSLSKRPQAQDPHTLWMSNGLMKLKAFAPDKILAHVASCSTPSLTDLPTFYTTWLCYTNLCPQIAFRLSHWLEHPSLRHRPDWKGFCMLSLRVLGCKCFLFPRNCTNCALSLQPRRNSRNKLHLQLWFIAEGCAPLNCLFLFSLLMSMWLPPDSLFWLLPLQRHRAAVVQGWGIVCGAWTRRHLEFCEGTQVIQNNSSILHAYSCLMWLQHPGAPGSFLQVQGSALCPTMHLLLQILFAVLAACKDGLIEFDGKRVHGTMHQIQGVKEFHVAKVLLEGHQEHSQFANESIWVEAVYFWSWWLYEFFAKF